MNSLSTAGGEIVWRCVRAKPKCEHLAARQLRALGEVEAFCPRLRHRKPTARGPVWFVEPLFPGYLFVRCDWSVRQRSVLATGGVTGQVHFGQHVPAVPDPVVAELRQSFADEEVMTVNVAPGPGDKVEIGEGPFRGTTGLVTRLLPARARVAVLLQFLGGTREVQVPLLSVLGLRDVRAAALS
jgi:transcriptional antiterminator RfaH